MRLLKIKGILVTIESVAWRDFKDRISFDSVRQIIHVALVFQTEITGSDICSCSFFKRRSNLTSIQGTLIWTLFRINICIFCIKGSTWCQNGKGTNNSNRPTQTIIYKLPLYYWLKKFYQFTRFLQRTASTLHSFSYNCTISYWYSENLGRCFLM